MKRSILLHSLAGAGLLIFSLTAVAQDRDRGDDSYRTEREARFRAEHWRARVFETVRQDVEHVRSVTWPSGGDSYRLDRTVDQLNQLQAKLADHVYDERDLNDVIGTLSRVVSDNRMAPRDRDILNDDLSRLRDYRDHHAAWDR